MTIQELITEGERILSKVKKDTLFIGIDFPQDVLDENNYMALIQWYENVKATLKRENQMEMLDEVKQINCTGRTADNDINKHNVCQIICKLKTLQ